MRWTALFRAGALIAASTWGVGAAALIAAGSAQSVLIALVTTAGIVAGGTTSLCPDLTLLRLYIASMLVPVLIAIIDQPAVHSLGTAAVILFYFVFLQVQSGQLHRDFFEALASAELAATAQRAADAANRAKSAFLANMSHELRTPLTSVIGYAELLYGSEHHDERIEYAQTIRRNGEHLLHLLNDILDLSKIEAAKMTVEAEPFALGPLIADVDLTKPIDRAELITTVALLSGRGHAPPRPAPGAPERAARLAPLHSAFAGDPDIAALLPSFCVTLRGIVLQLETALGAGDHPTLGRVAHQLAGAGGSYGFDAITAAARRLEAGLRAQPPDVSAAVAELLHSCQRALEAHDPRPANGAAPGER